MLYLSLDDLWSLHLTTALNQQVIVRSLHLLQLCLSTVCLPYHCGVSIDLWLAFEERLLLHFDVKRRSYSYLYLSPAVSRTLDHWP